MPSRARTDTRQLDLFYAFVGDVPLQDEREKEQPGAGRRWGCSQGRCPCGWRGHFMFAQPATVILCSRP